MNTTDLITVDPEILGGTPVFKGTRVPVKTLFDYLEGNYTRGWNTVKNGELIRLAETEFDLFITCDQNIRDQQDLAAHRSAILELTSNDLHRILSAGLDVCAAVAAIEPGEYVHLPIP